MSFWESTHVQCFFKAVPDMAESYKREPLGMIGAGLA